MWSLNLRLRNVELIEADVGQPLVGSLAERVFDTVVARAVAPPAAAWRLVRGLLAPAGVALLQSGEPLEACFFDGGEIRLGERTGDTWVTVVGNVGASSREHEAGGQR